MHSAEAHFGIDVIGKREMNALNVGENHFASLVPGRQHYLLNQVDI